MRLCKIVRTIAFTLVAVGSLLLSGCGPANDDPSLAPPTTPETDPALNTTDPTMNPKTP
jgi:hypothetical protein